MHKFEVHYWVSDESVVNPNRDKNEPYNYISNDGKFELTAKDWNEAKVKADEQLITFDKRFLKAPWKGLEVGTTKVGTGYEPKDYRAVDYYKRSYPTGNYRFEAVLLGNQREWIPDYDDDLV